MKFTASRSPEIVSGVSDTEAAKAATGKLAAESMAMLPVDEDDELETAYDSHARLSTCCCENCLCMAPPWRIDYFVPSVTC